MTSHRDFSSRSVPGLFPFALVRNLICVPTRHMLSLFVAFVCCSISYAAGHYEVRGRITDERGRPVPQAVVTVRGTGRHTVSDSAGVYRLAHLTGQQALTASAIGYRQLTHALKASADSVVVLDFRLFPLQNTLHEVEITTGRVGRLRHSAYNTIAIDTRALQNTIKTLSDALAAAPGVKVRETGGVGSDMNVSLDGFSGKHVKVFIDGVPQEGVGSAFGLNNIPVNFARHIEVYKGVVPVTFGTDAIGGVINVVTETPQAGWHVDGSYAGGSFNTHKSTLNWHRTWQSGWKLEMSAFQNYSDNNYTITAPVKDLSNGSIDFRHPERVRRFHDTYHNEALTVRGGVINRPWADRLLLGFTLAGMHKALQTGVRQEVVYGEKYRFGPRTSTPRPTLSTGAANQFRATPRASKITSICATMTTTGIPDSTRVFASMPAAFSPSTTVLAVSTATPRHFWRAKMRKPPSDAAQRSTSADFRTSTRPMSAGM